LDALFLPAEAVLEVGTVPALVHYESARPHGVLVNYKFFSRELPTAGTQQLHIVLLWLGDHHSSGVDYWIEGFCNYELHSMGDPQ
jgi:hypothetical protein